MKFGKLLERQLRGLEGWPSIRFKYLKKGIKNRSTSAKQHSIFETGDAAAPTQDCASALLPCVPLCSPLSPRSPDPGYELDPTVAGAFKRTITLTLTLGAFKRHLRDDMLAVNAFWKAKSQELQALKEGGVPKHYADEVNKVTLWLEMRRRTVAALRLAPLCHDPWS